MPLRTRLLPKVLMATTALSVSHLFVLVLLTS
jgi:hypothetical protein